MNRIYLAALSFFVGALVFSLVALRGVRLENAVLRERLERVPEPVRAVEKVAERVVEKPPFALLNAYVRSWGEVRYCIDFSEDLLAEGADLKAWVAVEPEVEGLYLRASGYPALEIGGEFVPGRLYRVRVRRGLPGESGRVLERDVDLAFVAPDLPQDLSFATTGVFFPVGCGVWQLPLRLTNPPEAFEVEVRRAHGENLIDFLSGAADRNTVRVLEKKLAVSLKPNERALVPLDLAGVGIGQAPGLYSLELSPGCSRRVAVVTDLALTVAVKENEALFVVRSLSGKAGVEGAKVELYSAKRRLLGSVAADGSGAGRLALPKLADAEDEPAMLVARLGGDVTYFSFDWLADHGDPALPAPGGEAMTAFLYPERGICRPGEGLTLFAMLRRSSDLAALGGVPLALAVRDPQGKVFARIQAEGDALGCYRARIELPAAAPTGGWSFCLVEPGASEEAAVYGRGAFQVAEFVPDDLKVRVSAEAREAAVAVSGRAAYYFGRPLEGGEVKVSIESASVPFSDARWKDFVFGFEDGSPIARVSGAAATDAKGDFSLVLPRPKAPGANPVSAWVSASAQSGAGSRAVTAGVELTLHTAPYYVGTREAETTEAGKVFECAAVSAGAEEFPAAQLRVVLAAKEWSWVLRERDGSYARVWQEERQVLGTNALALAEGRFTVSPPFSGSFELSVIDEAGTLRHVRDFWFWKGEAGERSANPNMLTFSLDAERYTPGETAELSFESPFAGEAIVITGDARIVPVKAGKNTIRLAIAPDTPAGSFFAGVTLVSEASPEREPQRLFGLASLPIDQAARRLNVALTAPVKALPGERIPVKIALTDHTGAPTAGQVQLWGVDEGVLALTGFKTPDPFAAFFGRKRCTWRFGDAYGLFYPVMRLDREAVGGDAETGGRYVSDTSEERKDSVVLLCDALAVPESGEAELAVTLPDHTGALRLMATAAAPAQTGSGEHTLAMRGPVALKVTAPRFLAPGDSFEILLEGFNNDVETGEGIWSIAETAGVETLTANRGKVSAPKGAAIAAAVGFKVKPGVETVTIRAEFAAGGETRAQTVAITVRPPLPAADSLAIETLRPGEARTFTSGPHDRIDAGSPTLSVRGALDWLNDYPHGCLEQTTAQAFPFLGAKAFAQSGIVPEALAEGAGGKIALAASRLAAMRLSDHTYAMWPGGRTAWQEGTLFAWHFLLEAETAGYAALEAEHRAGIIRNLIRTANDRSTDLPRRAYALYMLALAEPRHAATPARMAATEEADAYTAFLIGAALIRAGYPVEGLALLKPLLEQPFWEMTGARFGGIDSKTRRLGLALWILGDILPEHPANTLLARELQNALTPAGHWGSTQENAWASLGLARWVARHGGGKSTFTAAVNGGDPEPVTGSKSIEGKAAVRMANTGESSVCVYHRKRAIPAAFTPAASGFAIDRAYFNADGLPVTQCRAGDLLTAVITLSSPAPRENIVITDLLPAGLEIEDETLLTRSRVFDDPSKSTGFACRRKERRFDRFLAFGDLHAQSVVTYRVRATVRGTFALPPVQVESMYQSALRATARGHETFTVE